jgi:hypothetical protein
MVAVFAGLTYSVMPKATANEPAVEDPLKTRVALEYEGLFYPFGYPVRIRSNSALTLQAAEISYRASRQELEASPLDVRVLVAESSSPARTHPPVFRSQGHLLTLVVDAENFAGLDLDMGFGFGWITRATAEKFDYFRQNFLDVMIYCLLEAKHLVTGHSPCVRLNGTAS